MVKQRTDVEQEHYELMRRARAELQYFAARLANEVLPELSEQFYDAVQKGGLRAPEIDRPAMEAMIKRAVARSLNMKGGDRERLLKA